MSVYNCSRRVIYILEIVKQTGSFCGLWELRWGVNIFCIISVFFLARYIDLLCIRFMRLLREVYVNRKIRKCLKPPSLVVKEELCLGATACASRFLSLFS